MNWLKQHEAAIVSVVILVVTAWLQVEHDLPPEFAAIVLAVVTALNIWLHGHDKGAQVVPIESYQSLAGQLVNTVQQTLQLAQQPAPLPLLTAPVATLQTTLSAPVADAAPVVAAAAPSAKDIANG